MNTDSPSILDRFVGFFLRNRLATALLVLMGMGWGLYHAPFQWNLDFIDRDPVPVDAIPDIGENQQIIFAAWAGRSPQDVEDQVTYPLTSALLGVPEVKTIRSTSAFGFSMIFVIFNEDAEFYWTRSRILEKLNSLPSQTLPEGVQPVLGPDATALGQVFWYTLEGRDPEGNPAGGWGLDELRSIQDWTVRYALQGAEGVSEVASIGGYVREYQVDVDPDAMRAHRVTLSDVASAVRKSNLDVGASVIEINRAEYAVRSLGFINSLDDLRNTVLRMEDNVPVYLHQVAHITTGPALRRGALDKEGAETVGGVVVVRFGGNPMEAIQNVKDHIAQLAPSLPEKVLPDGTVSKVTIVPFYDRTELIEETLGTLNQALYLQILVTAIVVLIMVRHLASSILIAGIMPLAVLGCFIAMRMFNVDANIVSLSGIAIAIGTIVDMGIIVSENILKHLEADQPKSMRERLDTVYRATTEVNGAIVTAIATTIISFLPVFMMEGAEGKLFKPLAFTKTFVLLASVVVALAVIPAGAYLLFKFRQRTRHRLSAWVTRVLVVTVLILLARQWLPLGAGSSMFGNLLAAAIPIGLFLGLFLLYQRVYPGILRWCLDHRGRFLSAVGLVVFFGMLAWQGFGNLFGWLPTGIKASRPVSAVAHAFPGLGREFMPPLDEGSFLFMPSTLPHASFGETLDVIQKQDMAITAIHEVESAVGKMGRAESPLDPAPVQMIETVINYHPPFLEDAEGTRLAFAYSTSSNDVFRDVNGVPVSAPDGESYVVRGHFERNGDGELIPDRYGRPFPLWRPALDPDLNPGRDAWPGIRSPQDIWDAITSAAQVPGSTGASLLQPISARLVMLQSGMKSPMGIKVQGPTLEAVEVAGLALEKALKQVPAIRPETVFADRIVGKPYLEILPDRQALARYGVAIESFQDIMEMAIGGKPLTRTVEGRERYPVRVRYQRELRDNIEAIKRILVPAANGAQVPLEQVASVRYVRGPDMIRSEDTFLTGYVLFDKQPGIAEVDVVQLAEQFLAKQRSEGKLQLPENVKYAFAGTYENQVRAAKKLAVVIPLALAAIFLLLYFQFREYLVAGFVFTGIVVAWSGGFILLWLYNQPWFLDMTFGSMNLRELLQVSPINLSVAVWVGFLALFGIASDDGVVMSTYLVQQFKHVKPSSVSEMRNTTVEAGLRRIRPCLMTTATTLLALLPVLTSSGRGADIMIPMAIPSFGGMLIAVLTTLVTPVLYCWMMERRARKTAPQA